MSQKIIIFGFPHSGTSILKSITGHIEDVYEIYQETSSIRIESNSKYILCKYPHVKNEFFHNKYNDYIKIFIIRNPLWVFSSLNKRFSYKNVANHGLETYFKNLKHFINIKENPREDIHLIRYEDLFEKNYKNLKMIYDKIGFKYTNKIFDNRHYENKIVNKKYDMSIKPDAKKNHVAYRTWQINQTFSNKNTLKKLDLTEEQLKNFKKNENLKTLYPNINIIIKELQKE